MNREFVFDCDFVEGAKIMTHALGALFLEDHDNKRRITTSTRIDNTLL
jgi:hypothetical protein